MKHLAAVLLLLLAQPLPVAAESDDAGETLYQSRCGMCHQRPDPQMLTARQWEIVLQTMQKRMGHLGMPPFTAAEHRQILDYLSRHARGH